METPGSACQTPTSRSGAPYGSGLSRTPLTTAKIATEAPIPMTSVSTALMVNAGVRRRDRQAKRMEAKLDMGGRRVWPHLRAPRFGSFGAVPARDFRWGPWHRPTHQATAIVRPAATRNCELQLGSGRREDPDKNTHAEARRKE